MSWLTTPAMGRTITQQSFAELAEGNSTDVSSWYVAECDYVWPTLAVTAILCFVYSLLGAIGFIGNFLVVYTIFFKKGPQSVTSMLLCSLAVSDVLVVTIQLPFKLTDLVTDSWVLGSFPCKMIGYLNLMSPACSACMLMVIGLERFIVILYPLRARFLITRLKAKFIVAGSWVISFILAIPGAVLQEHKRFPDTREFLCVKEYQDNVILSEKAFVMYCLLVFYIIPLGIMGFAYITVCVRLYRSAKISRGLQSMKAPSSAKPLRTNANGFSGVSNPNAVASSVDDDPFSAGSEPRWETAVGGRVVVSGGSPHARYQRRPRRPVSIKDRQQVILMLILVVLLYALTWGPMILVMVLVAFNALNHLCMNDIFKLSATIHVLTFLNSAVNPIVYSFMSRNFRENVAQALRGICRCVGLGSRRRQGGRGGPGESMYQSSRYSSTTLVTQASSVRRGRSTSDGNCSPSRGTGQNIELTQYSRLPNTEPVA
ncbi:allatostatin-A receptor-like [Acanthaster planci]|uniref:Allatostatin-A receptor-like n=1 Tax=Acanthaster planci TaxID=133434 RepID=A0A8B7Y662_ACAPL|nr:allatostatin-A receptor-like [Acanthaster planci]XP_022087836.1 allatostatin-A receptor-like [Acanthaster planci]XP_022087838.1 allatostatin-A receptor-like [Acanthaster planci]XP_022087839.1 allatostatin-A receptor-like [Acanthaster planci]XP_022087840.1 allatostatin-A receptor-like [Acanthaster planci]